jgi:type IV secretory pathway TrbD component
MTDIIKRALTRTIAVKGPRGGMQQVEVVPSQRLVLGIQFAIIALLCLTALEIAHMVVVKTFSSEIFAAISLVVGTILEAVFGQKA